MHTLLLVGLMALQSDVASAVHHGVVRDDVIGWESTFITRGRGLLVFVSPQDAQVEGEGVVMTRDTAGRVVGLELPLDRWGQAVTVKTRQRRGNVLKPPLLVSGTVQKVFVDGSGTAFTPDPVTTLEHRLEGFSSRSVHHADITELERRMPSSTPRSGRPLYLRTSDFDVSAGITGELVDVAHQRLMAVGGAGVLAVVVTAVLGLLYRRLQRDAEAERVEKVIQAEFGPL